MTQMVKTTIVMPEEVFKAAKIAAISDNTTLSKLISDAVQTKVLTGDKKVRKKPLDPMRTLGRLSLGISKIYNKRSDLYEEHLKRKMGY